MHPKRRDIRYTPLQKGGRNRRQHRPLTRRVKGAKGCTTKVYVPSITRVYSYWLVTI